MLTFLQQNCGLSVILMLSTPCSSGLQRAAVQHLMETVDVWHVGVDGSVDFRVSSQQFQEMKGDLPECREVGSVEEIVGKAEQGSMSKRDLNKTQQEWFEEYVSKKWLLHV